MIGYKLLNEQLQSTSEKYTKIQYRVGIWVNVPGNGSYIASPHSLTGLLRGTYGPILAECEVNNKTAAYDDDLVVTYASVKIRRIAWLNSSILGSIALAAAESVLHLSHGTQGNTALAAAKAYLIVRTPETAKAALIAAVAAKEAADRIWAERRLPGWDAASWATTAIATAAEAMTMVAFGHWKAEKVARATSIIISAATEAKRNYGNKHPWTIDQESMAMLIKAALPEAIGKHMNTNNLSNIDDSSIIMAQCDMCGEERQYYPRDLHTFWICDECYKTRLNDDPESIPESVINRIRKIT